LISAAIVIRARSSKIIYRPVILGAIGLFAGIALFYATGGLKSRLNGSYASAYQYAFAPENTSAGLSSLINLLISHFQFNLRNVWPGLLFCLSAIFFYFIRAKAVPSGLRRSEWSSRGVYSIILLAYALLYLAASSVIRVEDELYGRYMAGVYICFAVTIAQIVDALVFSAWRLGETKITGFLGALALLLVLINADMFLAFNNYNMKGREIIRHLRHQSTISLNEPDLDMTESRIFKLRQYPILESWANPNAYGVEIQYTSIPK
jgi:hypothetical protein